MNNVNVFKAKIDAQRALWPLCDANFCALEKQLVRQFDDGIMLMHNPARIKSSTAKADVSAGESGCFLCAHNRPTDQITEDLCGYELLVNPYPVFPIHFTVSSREHVTQLIVPHLESLLDITKRMEGLTVFYNGPMCGASAPNHHHFQVADFDIPDNELGVGSGMHPYYSRGVNGIEILSDDKGAIISYLRQVMDSLPAANPEPMVNVLCRYAGGHFRTVIIPRCKHRPDCYGMYLISPASVEMAGYIVMPRREDFDSITHEEIKAILEEVTVTRKEINDLCSQILV